MMTTTLTRSGTALFALGLLVGALSACTPAPEETTQPTPTKTALFSSDEEAFAAAEATYRAYVAASNEDSSTSNVADFLAGNALENYIDARRQLEEVGLRVEGTTHLSKFHGDVASLRSNGVSLTATVCLDLSETRTVNSNGDNVTPPNRPSMIAMSVEMETIDEKFLILNESDEEDSKCDG